MNSIEDQIKSDLDENKKTILEHLNGESKIEYKNRFPLPCWFWMILIIILAITMYLSTK